MKHAANRTQPAVKAKAKTLAQIKPVKKIKLAAKQPISKIVSKSRSPKLVQKSKVAVKTATKNSPLSTKTAAKQSVSKLSAKTLKGPKTLSVSKAKPNVKQMMQPKAKKVAPKLVAKAIKVSIRKTKTDASSKRVVAVERTVKKVTATPKTKLKATAPKPKNFVKASAKTSAKTAKSKSPKVAVQKTKTRQTKVTIAAPAAKIKSVRQKAKPIVAAKKSKNTGKTKPIVAAQTTKRKKIAPIVPPKRINLQSKKVQPVIQAKKFDKKAEKIKPLAAAKKAVTRTQKLKPAISAATFGKPNRKIKKAVSVEKIKAVTKVIETVELPAPKPKNRKARPISSAVFRGKKERYDFKVFELSEKFEPIPAVYIISKRKTDRNKRGHHALICIGETASIAEELKRHRKGKCVKKHEANVVSILPEADEKMRLRIETDLKAAHAVVCNLD